MVVICSPPGGGWQPASNKCCWQTLKHDFQPKGWADRLPIPVCCSPWESPKSAIFCRNLLLQTAAETLVCAGMLRVPGYGVPTRLRIHQKGPASKSFIFLYYRGLGGTQHPSPDPRALCVCQTLPNLGLGGLAPSAGTATIRAISTQFLCRCPRSGGIEQGWAVNEAGVEIGQGF